MTVVAVPVGPSMRDAERAAGALAKAGVAVVLLHGSVARGDQHADSDIDLVAVFDDLDYSTRWRRRCELEVLAAEAAGRPVQVLVTDRPEWEHRSRRVATSFETGIAGGAVVLSDRPPNGVNWHKEIGMPASDFGEAVRSLHNTNQALHELRATLVPDPTELEELEARDAVGYLGAVTRRLRSVCSRSQSVLENALKTLVHLYGGEPPGKVHALEELLGKLPDRLRSGADATMAGLNLSEASKWRAKGTYPADYPGIHLEELVPTAHALASSACALGGLTAQHVADSAPGAEARVGPAAGSAGRETADAAKLCAGVERVLARWDFTRVTPTGQMGIPEPPETYRMEQGTGHPPVPGL